MKFKVLFVAALAMLAMLVTPAMAETRFVHHVPVANMTLQDNEPKALVVGYDFTILRFGRLHLLGAGAGMDWWYDPQGYDHANPFLTGHIASVMLTNPKSDLGITFGTRYVYCTKPKGSHIAFGFAISFH
jgi:hypothetical protein